MFQEGEKIKQLDTEKKPEFLYHASTNNSIEEFEPRQGSYRDMEEGPKIFATAEMDVAAACLIDWHDDWVNLVMHDGVPVLIVSDKERFLASDKGGTIYVLPSVSFTCDPKKGMGKHEWVSDEKVRPVNKIPVQSSVQKMKETGVKIYFVDKTVFDKLQSTEGGGWEKEFDEIVSRQPDV